MEFCAFFSIYYREMSDFFVALEIFLAATISGAACRTMLGVALFHCCSEGGRRCGLHN